MRKISREFVGGLLLALLAVSAHATDPKTRINQLGHSVWRVQDGVINAAPNVIVQTKDGYIWIATETGLLRFDGVRFVPFSPPGWDQMRVTTVTALLAAADGTLWIGTPKGLAFWKYGKLTIVPVEGHVNAIVEDHQSRVWATLSRKPDQPLCEVSTGKALCFGPNNGLPLHYGGGLDVSKDGSLFVASADVVANWSPEKGLQLAHEFAELSRGQNLHGISSIFADVDASLLISIGYAGKTLGLQKLKDGVLSPYTAQGFDGGSLAPSTSYRDRAGALWIGTYSAGIFRANDSGVEHFTSKEGLSGDSIRDFHEDREGNMWISTDGGIDCFRDLKVVSWSSPQGLPSGYVNSILAARDGSIFIGSHTGLNILRAGVLTSIGKAQGLPADGVTTLLQDRSGLIWMGVGDQLATYDGHKFTVINSSNGQPTGAVAALALDADGSVWATVLGQNKSIINIKDGKVTSAPLTSKAGFLLAANAKQGVWVDGRSQVGHFANGQLQWIPFLQNSATKGGVRSNDLALAPDGSLLVSTAVGVWGVRDGKSQMLGSANGLPCQSSNGLAFSSDQSLVVRTSCGLLSIKRDALKAWWSNSQSQLTYTLIDSFDGARLSASTFSPQMSRAPDGRIWMANEGGIQVLDPDHVPNNAMTPPVHIEEVVADRVELLPTPGLKLPPLTRDVEIQYTALSFTVPQKVRFKYMLEGRDKAWQEPGVRRTAFYQDLKPGHYRFRVIAANNDGLWNGEGDSLQFDVKPAWFQTLWFRVIWITCVLLFLWSMYLIRIRHLATSITASFNDRLAERTRVARELHDTFLQTVQGSKMVADDALAPDTDETRMRNALVKLSGWLEQATREAREALQSLRMSIVETNHLADSLRRAAASVVGSAAMSIQINASGEPRNFHPIVRDEIFQISFEAVRNAIQHSQGTSIQVTIVYDTDFSVKIVDDGVGILPAIALAGRSGHYGLIGMRERASRLRGNLKINRGDERGTIVLLSVPSSVAYQK
jgi:ligand-binding sensor domain-containing protein